MTMVRRERCPQCGCILMPGSSPGEVVCQNGSCDYTVTILVKRKWGKKK